MYVYVYICCMYVPMWCVVCYLMYVYMDITYVVSVCSDLPVTGCIYKYLQLYVFDVFQGLVFTVDTKY